MNSVCNAQESDSSHAAVASRYRYGAFILLCWGLAIGQQGCATTSKRYSPAKLPVKYQAPALTNARKVNLTRFAVNQTTTETIEPGDVLDVTLAAGLSKDDTLNFPVRVGDDGTASIPNIGTLRLSGMELSAAESTIAVAATNAGLFRSPHVTVVMKQPKLNTVFVMGAVKEPGVYHLRSSSSHLLAALTSAGDLADNAGTLVEIRRPDQGLQVPLPDMLAGQRTPSGHVLASHSTPGGELTPAQPAGRKSVIQVDLASATDSAVDDYKLVDGSVVMVEQRDEKPVSVLGLVKKPGLIEFPVADDLRLLDAISRAEGTSNLAADKVYVIRNPTSSQPIVIETTIRRAKNSLTENLRLSPGDVVSVEQTPSTVLIEALRTVGFNLGGAVF